MSGQHPIESFEPSSILCLIPKVEGVPSRFKNFRWQVVISLPFPFPSENCVSREIDLLGKSFSFSILDRLNQATQPAIYPEGNQTQLRNREKLGSAAIFDERTLFTDPNDAFSQCQEKIKVCFEHMNSFLSACQREAPYLTSWMVYPVMMFDVGAVHHYVTAEGDGSQDRVTIASAIAINPIKQLLKPVCNLQIPDSLDGDSPIDVANELLAEACLSLFRGSPRLTVLNSYAAVESLANIVFENQMLSMLLANHVPKALAENLVEEVRQRHKTDPKFLFHKGIKDACNRSLFEENKILYDKLRGVQDDRHNVAHTGHKPSHERARDAHRTCCEVAQWLADVGKFHVKPLYPEAPSSLDGFGFRF